MATKTRILIADNQGVLRAGLRKLIETQPDMEVSGEAADGFEAPGAARLGKPDIVLLAINMPGPGFQETIWHVRRASPDARIIVLTTSEDLAHVQSALQAGASGYVARTADSTEVVSAIHAVRAGRTFIDSSLSSGSPADDPPAPRPLEIDLSARELQVLRLLARGHSNQEVATQIGLSVKTVETYRHRICVKLGVNTRAELYQFAVSHRLLAVGDER